MKDQETIVVHKYSVDILRIMLSGIFIVASFNHIFNLDHAIQRMDNSTLGFLGHLFGDPSILILVTGGMMLIAGLSLLVGYEVKIVSSVLACILIAITITVQVGQLSTIGPLFKNIAILGALLLFITKSPKK